MNSSNHSVTYSAEDIQNYLSGRLTPLQMHAMEKAALEDPFLAEAMEGYAAVPAEEGKKILAGLKETFAQKELPAKVVTPSRKNNNWWKAAAAILIIGSTATFSYIFFSKSNRQEIAKNTPPQTTQPATAPVIAENSNTPETANEATADRVPEKENKTIVKDITRLPEEALADSAFVYTPPVTAPAAAKVTEDAKADEVVLVTKPAAPASASGNAAPAIFNNTNANEGLAKNNREDLEYYKKEKKAEAGYSAARSETALNKTFFAQVLGADNTPLPFANVNIKTENFGTYADVKGNFRLLSNDSVLTVEVKAAGFRPQTVTLKSNVQQNRIILSEDNTAFKERTVISSNTAAKSKISRKAALLKDSVMNVEPADGWDNYNTYVDNNIEVPDDILKNNIHGQVELSFDVKSNGAITNIKVDKSLCNNCDEAAIRMLQQGPQWKVKKGKKGKGKITVQF